MKRILLLIILVFASGSLFALDNSIEDYLSFSITPQFKIANGQITEYVFDAECKNTDNKLSELDWHLSTIALFNIQANFDIIKYINVGLSANFGVPQRSDYMQDSDWQNSIPPDPSCNSWLEDDPKERTDFSEHINHLDKYIDFKAVLGGNILIPYEIKITPHIAYKYEFISFSASKGYAFYKAANKSIYEVDWEKEWPGTIIKYEQEINTFMLGFSVNSKTIPNTIINLNFDISPKLTALNAIDYHYTRSVAFWDNFKNILLMEADASAQYSFTKNHSAGIYGNIQYIPLSKGDTSSRELNTKGNFANDKWYRETGNGGTKCFIWSLGFNYSFSL